jgi:hypothetical protein
MTNEDVRVDPAVARDVASAYLAAKNRHDPVTVAAFAQLADESDRLFRWITRPSRPRTLRVVFTTCDNPYRDAPELIASVRQFGTLEITTVARDPDRRHPVMGNDLGGTYDRFRAVHDALGHARMQLGFDRDGEFAVWLAQERFHGPLARRALAAELHGQHSVRWTTGDVAEPKATLLGPALLRRARRRGTADSVRVMRRAG